MKRRPRILLADDHTMLLDAFQLLLEPRCKIVGIACDGRALEVPYVFTDRVAGTSKLNQNEIFNYLKQLGRIYGARLRGKR